MANLTLLKLRLAKATANGDETTIKRLKKEIATEERMRKMREKK